MTTVESSAWQVVGDLEVLAPAWVSALGELQEIVRSRTANAGTYSYSYAELGDITSHARKVLSKHDLAVFQVATIEAGDITVRTTVMHTSGSHLLFAPFRLPAGNTAQNTGSAATYARRYSLMSILGLATEDDDGATAASRPPATLSEANVERFLTAATDAGVVVADVVETATGGRTTDPADVYVSEVAALRDALSRAAKAREDASGVGEQISPTPDATVEGGDG
jgi:hypothetical protein